MQAYELLRAAALIVEAGWASGCDAQDDAGSKVPMFVGTPRATINPAAVRFSAYDAICRAMSQSKRTVLSQTMWSKLRDLAIAAGAKGRRTRRPGPSLARARQVG